MMYHKMLTITLCLILYVLHVHIQYHALIHFVKTFSLYSCLSVYLLFIIVCILGNNQCNHRYNGHVFVVFAPAVGHGVKASSGGMRVSFCLILWTYIFFVYIGLK